MTVPAGGPLHEKVTVRAVDLVAGVALCTNGIGKERRIALSIIRVNKTPIAGEIWIIDRLYDQWSFAAQISG